MNSRQLLLLLWVVWFPLRAQAESSQTEPQQAKPEQAEPTESNRCTSTLCGFRQDERRLLEAGGLVRRDNDQLQLPLSSPGEALVLVDVPADSKDSDRVVYYSYAGFLPAINAYLVALAFWEGHGYFLINKRSGQKVYLSGYPEVSPDAKHVLSVSSDLIAGYSPNTVEVFSVSSGAFKSVAELKLGSALPNGLIKSSWGLGIPRWINNQQAVMVKFCLEIPDASADVRERPCGLVELRERDSKWQLRELIGSKAVSH
ncbi:MAG: hypothetical protein RIR70_986 [Pseudomonadota bacterium]